MKFIQISDIHYLEHYRKNASGYKAVLPNMTNPLKHIEKLGKIVEKEPVDAIFITGDLIDDGTMRDYEILKQHFETCFRNIPIIIGPGNHDDHEALTQVFFNESMTSNHFNKVHDLDNLRIIYFDNTLDKSPTGSIIESQYEWLHKTLAQSEKPVILLTHHHLVKDQSQIPSTPIDDKFVDLIANSHVVAILCGHTHHAYTTLFANKLYTTSPSLSFQGYCNEKGQIIFEENPGYQIIEYQNNTVSIQTKYLKEKPIILPSSLDNDLGL